MKQQEKLNKVIELLSNWLTQIRLNNAVYFYDINKQSENLALKLLNEIYDYNLKNLNYDNSNQCGIDLGDKSKDKIAFQVTSRTDKKKITQTLETFFDKGLDKIYTGGIRFLILNHEDVKFGTINYENICFKFDKGKHIITEKKIIKEIEKLYSENSPKFDKVFDILIKEFNENLYKTKKEILDFKEKINELTENFQGRNIEISTIKKYISEENKGFIFIFGDPGVGKSTFIAKLSFYLKTSLDHSIKNDELYSIEYFIQRGTIHGQLSCFMDHINQKLDEIYATFIPIGSTNEEKKKNLHMKLNHISSKIVNQKIIILIDGLDEGIEEHQSIVEFLINVTFTNIFVIYSSRNTKEIKEFYNNINKSYSNYTKKIDLYGLKEQEVKNILTSFIDVEDIKGEYTKKIIEKSKGNPLYVKLLGKALSNKEIEQAQEFSLASTPGV